MLDLLKKLEHWISLALIVMLAVVVVLATVGLGVAVARDILAEPLFFPGISKLLEIFGQFLLVLIGIELLETMRAFASDGVVRLEVVLTVAMIALARKIIVLEFHEVTSIGLFGVAALLGALSLAYQVFVRGRPSA